MKEQLKILETVQELDLKILNLKTRQETLPKNLHELEGKIAVLQKKLDAISGGMNEKTKLLQQATSAIDLNKERLDRSTKRMEEVKNAKEYAALVKETDQLKKMNEELEAQKTTAQSAMGGVEKEVTTLQDQIKELEGKRSEEAGKIGSEEGTLRTDLDALLKERNAKTGKVSRPVLSSYERVAKARQGIGLCAAVEGRCTACNMRIPPQMYNALHRMEEVQNCPSCQRLIFIPEEPAAASESTASKS